MNLRIVLDWMILVKPNLRLKEEESGFLEYSSHPKKLIQVDRLNYTPVIPSSTSTVTRPIRNA